MDRNDDKLFGIKFKQDITNCKESRIGSINHIKYSNFDVISHFTRNSKKQYISHSKIKKYLHDIKMNAIITSSSTLYFNIDEIRNLNIKGLRNLINNIFNNHRIIFCTLKEKCWEEKNIKAMSTISSHYTSPVVECIFMGDKVEALIDTGAQISLVDFNFVKERNLMKKTEDYGSIMGITGNSIEIKGVIKADLIFEDHKDQKIHTTLHIIDGGMETPILLGMDTLTKGNFSINLGNLSVTCNGRPIGKNKNTPNIYKEVHSEIIRANKNIYLKSHHGIDYTFKSMHQHQLYTIEQTNSFLCSKGINYPQHKHPSMEPMTNGTININLENNTNSCLKIKKGTMIAKINFIEEQKTGLDMIHENQPEKRKHCDRESKQEFFQRILDRTVDKTDTMNFEKVILENQYAFAQDDKDLGCVQGFEHRIDLEHDKPIASKPYRIPHSRMEIVEKEIHRMLEIGVIQPSKSPYAAPCLLVWKKNGKPRLVIDFRNLNKIVEPFQYPLPHLETAIQSLGGNKMFSTLDLISGYHQVPLRKEDQKKTAFTTGRGLYEFTRSPFGLITSGAVMQSIIERVLDGLNHRICLVYVDDIIIVGKNKEDHDKNLNEVLQRLAQYGYKIRIDKCVFRASQVECLGHVVSSEGIVPNPDKTSSLKSRPIPKNAKQVKSFMGVCGYYRRFVNNFAEISRPLIDLTKKNTRFVWSQRCQEAYDKLIELLTSPPILTYPDYNKSFIVTTDASRTGIGAVLSQEQDGIEKPIAYYSRKLNKAETNYPIYDLEGLAIKTALNKWRLYLYGYKVTIRTDNQPIIGILKGKNCEGRISKYLSTILLYDIEYKYLPGKKNLIADFLSRSCEEAKIIKEKFRFNHNEDKLKINRVKTKIFPTLKEIQEATSQDTTIMKIIKRKHQHYNYVCEDKIWYCEDKTKENRKLMVPKKLVKDVIQYYHCNLGMHQGMAKTYKRISESVYWYGMKEDIQDYVSKCSVCKEGKFDHRPKHVLSSFPETNEPFQRIHIDIVGPFKKGKYRNKYICTVVDAFSRYVIAKAISKKSSNKVIDVIFQEMITKGRCPKLIVTDFGSEFTSMEFVNFCHQYKIDINYTPPYHHSSNGLVERVNYSIESLLRCAIIDFKGNWVDHLPDVVNAINSSHHEATGTTPNHIIGEPTLTGIKTLDQNIIMDTKSPSKEVNEKSRRYMAKRRIKENKYRRYINYKVGETVYVKVTNVSGKLQPIYQGPGKITEIKGHQVTVKIQENILRRVHVDFLKK